MILLVFLLVTAVWRPFLGARAFWRSGAHRPCRHARAMGSATKVAAALPCTQAGRNAARQGAQSGRRKSGMVG